MVFDICHALQKTDTLRCGRLAKQLDGASLWMDDVYGLEEKALMLFVDLCQYIEYRFAFMRFIKFMSHLEAVSLLSPLNESIYWGRNGE